MVTTRSSDRKLSTTDKLVLRSKTVDSPASTASTPSRSARKRGLNARQAQESPAPKRARTTVGSGDESTIVVSQDDSKVASTNVDNMTAEGLAQSDATKTSSVTVEIPIPKAANKHRRFDSEEPVDDTVTAVELEKIVSDKDETHDENEDDDSAPEVTTVRRSTGQSRNNRKRGVRTPSKLIVEPKQAATETPETVQNLAIVDVPTSSSTVRSFLTANEEPSSDASNHEHSEGEEDTIIVVAQAADSTPKAVSTNIVRSGSPTEPEASSMASTDATITNDINPPFTTQPSLNDADVINSTSKPLAAAAAATPLSTHTKFNFTDDFIPLAPSATPNNPQQTKPQTARPPAQHHTSLSSYRRNKLQSRTARHGFNVEANWARKRSSFVV